MNKQTDAIDILNAVAKSDHEPLFSNTDNLTVELDNFSSADEVAELMSASNELKALIRQPQADQATTRELTAFIEQFEDKKTSSDSPIPIRKIFSWLMGKFENPPFALKTTAATAVLVLAISLSVRMEPSDQWQSQYEQFAMAPAVVEIYERESEAEALAFNLPIMRGPQDMTAKLRPIFSQMKDQGAFSAEIVSRQGERDEMYLLERLARIEEPRSEDQFSAPRTLISTDPSSECDLFRLSPSVGAASQTIDRSSYFSFCDDGFLDTATRIQ